MANSCEFIHDDWARATINLAPRIWVLGELGCGKGFAATKKPSVTDKSGHIVATKCVGLASAIPKTCVIDLGESTGRPLNPYSSGEGHG